MNRTITQPSSEAQTIAGARRRTRGGGDDRKRNKTIIMRTIYASLKTLFENKYDLQSKQIKN